jgi:hypothetical protein
VSGVFSVSAVNDGAKAGVELLAVVLDSSLRSSSELSHGTNNQTRRRAVARRPAPRKAR